MRVRGEKAMRVWGEKRKGRDKMEMGGKRARFEQSRRGEETSV